MAKKHQTGTCRSPNCLKTTIIHFHSPGKAPQATNSGLCYLRAIWAPCFWGPILSVSSAGHHSWFSSTFLSSAWGIFPFCLYYSVSAPGELYILIQGQLKAMYRQHKTPLMPYHHCKKQPTFLQCECQKWPQVSDFYRMLKVFCLVFKERWSYGSIEEDLIPTHSRRVERKVVNFIYSLAINNALGLTWKKELFDSFPLNV